VVNQKQERTQAAAPKQAFPPVLGKLGAPDKLPASIGQHALKNNIQVEHAIRVSVRIQRTAYRFKEAMSSSTFHVIAMHAVKRGKCCHCGRNVALQIEKQSKQRDLLTLDA